MLEIIRRNRKIPLFFARKFLKIFKVAKKALYLVGFDLFAFEKTQIIYRTIVVYLSIKKREK